MTHYTESEDLTVIKAYSDIIEVCGHLEFKQGVRRDLVSQALLSAALRLCGSEESFSKAIEDTERRIHAANHDGPPPSAHA